MSDFIKAEKVVSTSLGLLRRELVLPRLVWTDAKLDPTLSKNDTVSVRLPAWAPARSRALRSGSARTKDGLFERKVDVVLETDVYKDVPITDEQLSLDIANFGEQVLNPVTLGIAEQLEQEVLDTIEGTTYENSIVHDISDNDDAYETVVAARALLNDARVPFEGRALVVGSAFESELLTSAKFVDASQSGSTDTLRKGLIGHVAGFDVFVAQGIDPSKAYAFHRTAYAMVQRAPIVPMGAPWGAVQSYQGLAIRNVRVFDPDLVEDRFVSDAWIGVKAVTDDGYFDVDGRFIPTTEPDVTVGPTIALATSAAADDIIDTGAAHGLVAGDLVQFPSLTGGAGLTEDTDYYVIAANLAATTFQVSTTDGGSAALFTTDITAGTVAKKALSTMVRAVEITVQA